MWRGMSVCLQATIIINMWPGMLDSSYSSDDQTEIGVYTLFVYGIGQTIAAPITGRLQDKFGHKAILLLSLSLLLIFTPFIIIINEIHEFTWPIYLCMVGLGYLDNANCTFISIVCGFEFESKIIPF